MQNNIYKKISSNRELSNDFSFTKEAIYSINNLEFKSGANEFLTVANDSMHSMTTNSYIWSALSATCDDISEVLYSNILNYIDNVSNVDTCNIKALQSMIDIVGTNYTIFKHLELMPYEILKLLDFFSIRNDYLIDYRKTSYNTILQLLSAGLLSAITSDDISKFFNDLSSYRKNLLSIDIATHKLSNVLSTMKYDDMLSTKYISYDALSTIEYNAIYDVLTSNVYKLYNDINHTQIWQTLSNYILNGIMLSTDNYKFEISKYKTLTNISPNFNEVEEVDNIENGLSQYTDYSNAEQHILDIEINERKRPYASNVLSSRYAYYDRQKVLDYINFIETEYCSNISSYISSVTKPYQADTSYIEVNSISTYVPLLSANDNNECIIRDDIIRDVALLLVDMTNKVKDIREYLKSHAQRIYMKGTWLLISYIINEYLNDNVYPTVRKLTGKTKTDLPFSSTDTTIDLIQYIDLTLYFNIQTDSKYDKIESPETDMLNSRYWIDNGTTNNLNSLDSTSIFIPYEKGKSAIARSFSMSEIANFYMETLNNRLSAITDNNKNKVNTHLNDFLSTVFNSAADSTFFDKDTNRIMCELKFKNFTHTKDIENYLSAVVVAENNAKYILSTYLQIDNMRLDALLDLAYLQYKLILAETYMQTVDENVEKMNAFNRRITDILDNLSLYESLYQNLVEKYTTYVAANLQYTGQYKETTSSYLYDRMLNFNAFAINELTQYLVPSMRAAVILGISNLLSEYTAFLNSYKSYLSTDKVARDYNIRILHYYDEQQHILIDSYIYNEIRLQDFCENYFDSMKYEYISEYLNSNLIRKLQLDEISISEQYNNALLEIHAHVKRPNINSYFILSNMLSDYYDESISLASCSYSLSLLLDYTALNQYKYKTTLFNKYIGLSSGQLPYFNIENSYHPSYQIHPCLKNFTEYVDYSYAIESLLGISEQNINYIVQRNINDIMSNDGYLLSIWCNPLNGNADYLSRYEQSNHIDEIGNINPVFGYDGLHYPPALALFKLHSKEELHCDSGILSSYYEGLDLSESDILKINSQLSTYHDMLSSLLEDETIDIYKYGIDIYENSYILIKNYDNSAELSSKANKLGTLWLRRKNHPIAFPAIVFNDENTYDYTSLIEYLNTSDAVLSVFSNTIYSSMLLSSLTSKLSTPEFTDFMFSLDKKQLLLNGVLSVDNTSNLSTYMVKSTDTSRYAKPTIAVNNIVQTYNSDEYRYQLQFALSTDNENKEFISHPELSYDFKQYYVKYGKIGAIYIDYIGQRLAIKIFDLSKKYDEHSKAIEQALSTNNICLDIKQLACVDCKFNGDIDVVQYTNDKNLTACSSYLNVQFDYNSLSTLTYANISSSANSISVLTFTAFGNMLIKQHQKEYMPFVSLGFIPIIADNCNDITDTALTAEFEEENLLKFLLIGDKSDDSNGIDFKFIYPLRMYEAYKENVKPIDDPYHKILSSAPYSDLSLYSYADIHFLETTYNQYIFDENYANFLDMTYEEQQTYLSTAQSTGSKFNYYKLLANYDVARYLQAFGSELSNGNDNDPYLVKPYLLFTPANSDVQIPAPYINAKKDDKQTINTDNFVLNIANDTCISISWLYNTESPKQIKLDFNTYYYEKGIANTDNIRNKYHAFLNLDRPGDAGYLRCPLSKSDFSGNCRTYFIKNISDESPKFAITYIGLLSADPYEKPPFGQYESDIGKYFN